MSIDLIKQFHQAGYRVRVFPRCVTARRDDGLRLVFRGRDQKSLINAARCTLLGPRKAAA